MSTQNQEPTREELMVVETINNLKELAQIGGTDFSQVIKEIEAIHDTHIDQSWKEGWNMETMKPLEAIVSMQGYAEASGRGVARRIVEANKAVA